MRALVLLGALLVGGCGVLPRAPEPHPFDGATWRESADGRIALCVPSGDCYRPSASTWDYFLGAECPAETEEVK